MRYIFLTIFVIFLGIGCTTVREPDVSLASLSIPEINDEFTVLDPEFTMHDLGKLRVGMTKAEVYALFSRPRAVKQAPRDEYWEYIWFELYFREGLLANWFELDL